MAMTLSITRISCDSTSITVSASSTGSVNSCSWRLALYDEDGPDDDYQNFIDSFWSTSCPASFNNRTFTGLDPGTDYVVVCFGYADDDWSNIITSSEENMTTLPQYTVTAIAGTEGIASINIISDIDSDSTTEPDIGDEAWVNVEEGESITVSYTFLDGWAFDYLETSEGNTASAAISSYTYNRVWDDLDITIYAKKITSNFALNHRKYSYGLNAYAVGSGTGSSTYKNLTSGNLSNNSSGSSSSLYDKTDCEPDASIYVFACANSGYDVVFYKGNDTTVIEKDGTKTFNSKSYDYYETEMDSNATIWIQGKPKKPTINFSDITSTNSGVDYTITYQRNCSDVNRIIFSYRKSGATTWTEGSAITVSDNKEHVISFHELFGTYLTLGSEYELRAYMYKNSDTNCQTLHDIINLYPQNFQCSFGIFPYSPGINSVTINGMSHEVGNYTANQNFISYASSVWEDFVIDNNITNLSATLSAAATTGSGVAIKGWYLNRGATTFNIWNNLSPSEKINWTKNPLNTSEILETLEDNDIDLGNSMVLYVRSCPMNPSLTLVSDLLDYSDDENCYIENEGFNPIINIVAPGAIVNRTIKLTLYKSDSTTYGTSFTTTGFNNYNEDMSIYDLFGVYLKENSSYYINAVTSFYNGNAYETYSETIRLSISCPKAPIYTMNAILTSSGFTRVSIKNNTTGIAISHDIVSTDIFPYTLNYRMASGDSVEIKATIDENNNYISLGYQSYYWDGSKWVEELKSSDSNIYTGVMGANKKIEFFTSNKPKKFAWDYHSCKIEKDNNGKLIPLKVTDRIWYENGEQHRITDQNAQWNRCYKWNQNAANQAYTNIVEGSGTILANQLEYDKYYGCYIHWTEWNRLRKTIRQWYVVKKKSLPEKLNEQYDVKSGDPFYAIEYNAVANAINGLTNGDLEDNKIAGQEISASLLNNLMIEINKLT